MERGEGSPCGFLCTEHNVRPVKESVRFLKNGLPLLGERQDALDVAT
jgi:hypothetical protein